MPFTNDEEIKESKSSLHFYVFILSLFFYIFSLFTNCFCTTQLCRTSLEALLTGWLAMLTGGAAISWLANPFLFTAWILIFKNKNIAWLFSLLASIFSLLFLMFDTIIENEAGTVNPILNIGIGYWLWLSSCLVSFFGICIIIFLKKKQIDNALST
ncbi:MAG: hypothetical protein KA319_02025 [Ferruginibacter sp.]|nr:hypothetical protein [Ferruginibacter sp.]